MTIGRRMTTSSGSRGRPGRITSAFSRSAETTPRPASRSEAAAIKPPVRPDLAIEVVWTSGRLDKLAIYRKLGVREVWYWRKGTIAPHGLRDERYEPLKASEVLPGIDLAQLASFLERPTTSQSIREYRAALAGG